MCNLKEFFVAVLLNVCQKQTTTKQPRTTGTHLYSTSSSNNGDQFNRWLAVDHKNSAISEKSAPE